MSQRKRSIITFVFLNFKVTIFSQYPPNMIFAIHREKANDASPLNDPELLNYAEQIVQVLMP